LEKYKKHKRERCRRESEYYHTEYLNTANMIEAGLRVSPFLAIDR
jgi:hypothetical protein